MQIYKKNEGSEGSYLESRINTQGHYAKRIDEKAMAKTRIEGSTPKIAFKQREL